MVSDNKHPVTPVFWFEVIFAELRSQGVPKVSRCPTLAAVFHFDGYLARSGGRCNNHVRFVAFGDFGFAKCMKPATRARIHLFDEPMLNLIFVFCAFKERSGC